MEAEFLKRKEGGYGVHTGFEKKISLEGLDSSRETVPKGGKREGRNIVRRGRASKTWGDWLG